jgi:hypothetical protein
MALAVSGIKRKADGQGIIAHGKITASGNYSTGGDALNLSSAIGYTNRKPDIVLITGKAGFIYQYDHVNLTMFVYCNTAGGANNALGEHTAAGYVAGVTGDDIRFLAFWLAVPQLPSV